ncbi:efflux RND transporter periplasmic adaptor subunit [Inhella gelatinilytica]|uniref:Efflux RND transporter periplasmic adaptor subunit n=1 Tax=Inhella gelatinilytica TaxID=2795030 RepID=A0A931J009_9BURK|nr:efflux RND transporter periplasmic adaptor subunit [Inhella gelatinilytica]MBH9553693.1 efflux RND transporter periplasmic adaptor subunit [Inhella gelatinilytica]
MKRLLMVGLLALLLVGSVWLVKQRPTGVALVQPIRGEAIEAVFATGAVEPALQVMVAPRVGGRLAELLAEEGQMVKQGQVLARLETAEVEAQLQELNARERAAQLALERAEALVAQKFVAASEADRARAERDAVRAQIARIQAQRGYAQLLAPTSGPVLRREAEVGQFVAAGQVLFQIGGGTTLRVSTEIDEEDIARVAVGQPVVLRAAALGAAVFEGTVDSIPPKGDPIARSYRVKVKLIDAPAALRVGMTVDANIIQARRSQALLLPVTAVQSDQVWRVMEGRAQPVPVQRGATGHGRVEIRSGLKEGEAVIARPEGLVAGQRVRVAP